MQMYMVYRPGLWLSGMPGFPPFDIARSSAGRFPAGACAQTGPQSFGRGAGESEWPKAWNSDHLTDALVKAG